jgi:hypothetical protein
MKKIIITSMVLLSLYSCKKSDSNKGTYKVKYVVSGTAVDQFKITVNSADKSVSTPFTGTRDTTLYVTSASNIKLDAKGNGASVLTGTIYVDDTIVASGSDADANGDNKTEVKLNYDIPTAPGKY